MSNYQDYAQHLNVFEQKIAPKELYHEGDFSLLTTGIRVSVVGSRKASPEGLKRANLIARELVNNGITVVSGLAEGIDTEAHKTAVARGGKTIAVLGTPLNEVYPKSNKALLDEIKANHLAVSQFPEGYPMSRKNFPQRNKTMALISDATIIIEASENSGTRHQGWEALKVGRTVLILENILKGGNVKWAHEMLDYGAQMITRENYQDAIREVHSFTSIEKYSF